MGKNVSLGEQERLDGLPVTIYEGKFAGGFDVDEDLGREIGFDDVVTFLVTGRVGSVGFGETKLGDIKRINTFQVTSSTALDSKMAEKVLNSLGSSVPGINTGQLSIPGTNGGGPTPEAPSLDDDDEELAYETGPSEAQPVSDPVLARFLKDA